VILHCGFPPVYDRLARVLILGSMPGIASLEQGEYYAHPRNAFWPIMGELVGAGPGLPYAQRLARLRAAGVALWDVLYACRREGSLDARIEIASEQPNAIPGLLAECRGIDRILFNGGAAERLFSRHVAGRLVTLDREFQLQRLPSTSPAYAAMPFAAKLAAWRSALGAARPGQTV